MMRTELIPNIAEVGFSCGRYYLEVAGITVAIEGDSCRSNEIPEEFLEPIPEDELEYGRIGGQSVKDMDIKVVRLFRGDRWTEKMLQYVADEINVLVAKQCTE